MSGNCIILMPPFIMTDAQLTEAADKLRKDEDVQEFYLGLHAGDEGDKKSFKDVKHYKRRKRWLS